MANDVISQMIPNVNLGNIPIVPILIIVGFMVLIGLLIGLAFWISDKRKHNILVEVTPYWSVKEAIQEKLVIKQPSKFEKLFGMNKPKRLIYQDLNQSSQSYFVKGAYKFNKKTGTYYLQLKGGEKAKIQGLDYKYFKPIKYGNIFFPCIRYIHLLRYGPADYKPVSSKFSSNGLKEIRNAYDSEATYVSIATQMEVINRFRKSNLLLQLLPWIVAVIVIVAFIIATYMIGKELGGVADQIGTLAGAIGEYTKALLSASK